MNSKRYSQNPDIRQASILLNVISNEVDAISQRLDNDSLTALKDCIAQIKLSLKNIERKEVKNEILN